MDENFQALVPSRPVRLAIPPPDRRKLGAILWQVISAVEAAPVPPPEVAPALSSLPPVVRLYECLRLFLLDAEYSLSPDGGLRGIAKLACRVAVVVGILSLSLAVVLACISVLLAAAVTITGQLVLILWNLLEAALLLVALLAIGIMLLVTVRLLTRRADAGGQVRR